MSARCVVTFAIAIIAFGCGGAGSSPDSIADDAAIPATPDAPEAKTAAGSIDPVGSWENGSCGERQYNRRINFFASGNFTAIDAVAPCPPHAKCVWSGIIRWGGSWKIVGESLRLSVKPVQGEKLPEVLPTEFVVLGRKPLSIGERIGDLICPYRRVD